MYLCFIDAWYSSKHLDYVYGREWNIFTPFVFRCASWLYQFHFRIQLGHPHLFPTARFPCELFLEESGRGLPFFYGSRTADYHRMCW